MIVVRVDQSINQSDNYIMTVSTAVVFVKPSSPETDVKTNVKNNVKTDVKTNPVVETQYITIDIYKIS